MAAMILNGRYVGYYMVRILDSKKLEHEPNGYQPDPHGFAPMYWDGVFINYDELIWSEHQIEVGRYLGSQESTNETVDQLKKLSDKREYLGYLMLKFKDKIPNELMIDLQVEKDEIDIELGSVIWGNKE